MDRKYACDKFNSLLNQMKQVKESKKFNQVSAEPIYHKKMKEKLKKKQKARKMSIMTEETPNLTASCLDFF